MHLCILSLEAATPENPNVHTDFLPLTFDSKEKKKKNFSRLSRKFFYTCFDERLWRFGDERGKSVFDEKERKYVSNICFGSTLIFPLQIINIKLKKKKKRKEIEKEFGSVQLKIRYILDRPS